MPDTPSTRAWPPSLSFGTDFAGHARHFRGERAELIDHRVDGVLQLQELAAHVDRDLLRQVAVGHGGRHFGDVADLAGQVAGHRVHAVGQVLPRAGDAFHRRLAAELAFGADFAGHARHFRGERAELIDHAIDGLGRAQELAFQRPAVEVERHRLREIALGHGADDAGHFARRMHQVADQRIDRVDRAGPRSAEAPQRRPLLDLSFLADDATDAIHLVGHAFELVHHVVERVADFACNSHPGGREPRAKVPMTK